MLPYKKLSLSSNLKILNYLLIFHLANPSFENQNLIPRHIINDLFRITSSSKFSSLWEKCELQLYFFLLFSLLFFSDLVIDFLPSTKTDLWHFSQYLCFYSTFDNSRTITFYPSIFILQPSSIIVSKDVTFALSYLNNKKINDFDWYIPQFLCYRIHTLPRKTVSFVSAKADISFHLKECVYSICKMKW